MIVAAGTGDGQTENAARHRIDLIVDVVVAIVEPPAGRQKAERREGPFVFALRQFIRGELLANELIVGQVAVERIDDVIAIGVRIRIAAILLKGIASRIGIASDIEPMSAPPSAVLWRREQPIDLAIVRIRRRASCSKSSLLPIVGGRPSKSNDSRRSNVRRSACWRSMSPAACNFAATNASSGLCVVKLLRSTGIAGAEIG